MGNERPFLKQGTSQSKPIPPSFSSAFYHSAENTYTSPQTQLPFWATGSRSQKFIALVDDAPEIRQGQSFPLEYREPLELLWRDPGVQLAYSRGNEYALPESLP
jgi:hypothetical protein